MSRTLRALVVDDSAYNRRTLTRMLESGGVTVVGTAADGEEALREALRLEPDVITLDLEMPRMDGFTFLRILMARRPTPVVVISSYARKANVFRALELGAIDFIPKPSRFITDEIEVIREELFAKLDTVRGLTPHNLGPPPALPEPAEPAAAPRRPKGPLRVVAIGASTGGPPALQQIVNVLPEDLQAAVVICQHMPPRFTRAFAERMHRTSELEVREAADGDVLAPGTVLVAPGGLETEIVRRGEELVVRTREVSEPGLPVPNIDALFTSLAEAAGPRTLGVVLTGMGRDGRRGVEALTAAGGRAAAESEETAVVFGMPGEAIATGKVDWVLPLRDLPEVIVGFASEAKLPQSRRR